MDFAQPFDLETYHIRPGVKRPFDLLAVCKPRHHYYVPAVVAMLNQQGIAVGHIVEELARQMRESRGRVSYERTSLVFITGNTRGGRVEKRRLGFFPVINDSCISHFMIRPA